VARARGSAVTGRQWADPYGVSARVVNVVVLVVLALTGAVAAALVLTRTGLGPDSTVRGAASQGGVLPEPGETGEATCADPAGGVEWRVRWRAQDGALGTEIVATGFASRALPGWTPSPTASGEPTGTYTPAGVPEDTSGAATESPEADDDGWVKRDLDNWQLRWRGNPRLSEIGTLQVETDRRGTLAVLASVPVLADDSPRFITPDGSCTVFLLPFGEGKAEWPSVAVFGDSLVSQLGPDASDLKAPGMLQERLLKKSVRPEVTGQGGRRWTPMPGKDQGIDGADQILWDEIRGLRGAEAHVVALGVNDAGWVSMAVDDNDFELRMAWVLLKLEPFLKEIQDSGQCTVVVTAGDRKMKYVGGDEDRYAEAATRINNLLRRLAAENPDDDLQLWDWASISSEHHVSDPESWFGSDTIHLNREGRTAYANQLTEAATLC
jgi:lysophospholipase L1-like esterase